MCNRCGCNISPANQHLEEAGEAVVVLQGLLAENDRQAQHNREHFEQHNVLVINVMSSPGAGKTALLETTIAQLKGRYVIAVIEGDLETENDAERIRAQGVEAIQITTGSACHLDAHMIHNVLHQLDLRKIDLLFIENVGNLVCPAGFDLGQHYNVTLLSTTEGDDKPAKYPLIFRAADLVILNKSDLLSVLDDFDPAKAEQHLRNLATDAPMLTLSARKGEGTSQWFDWLMQRIPVSQTAEKTTNDIVQSHD